MTPRTLPDERRIKTQRLRFFKESPCYPEKASPRGGAPYQGLWDLRKDKGDAGGHGRQARCKLLETETIPSTKITQVHFQVQF